MTYTYDPLQIMTWGKDRMRFELSDTLVDGGSDTCVFSDEEYAGFLHGRKTGRKGWLYAKLYALEAILYKMAYQVDTKIDVLTYDFGKRAELWRKLYDQTRQEILAMTGLPLMDERAKRKPPYFYTAMHENPATAGHENKAAHGVNGYVYGDGHAISRTGNTDVYGEPS